MQYSFVPEQRFGPAEMMLNDTFDCFPTLFSPQDTFPIDLVGPSEFDLGSEDHVQDLKEFPITTEQPLTEDKYSMTFDIGPGELPLMVDPKQTVFKNEKPPPLPVVQYEQEIEIPLPEEDDEEDSELEVYSGVEFISLPSVSVLPPVHSNRPSPSVSSLPFPAPKEIKKPPPMKIEEFEDDEEFEEFEEFEEPEEDFDEDEDDFEIEDSEVKEVYIPDTSKTNDIGLLDLRRAVKIRHSSTRLPKRFYNRLFEYCLHGSNVAYIRSMGEHHGINFFLYKLTGEMIGVWANLRVKKNKNNPNGIGQPEKKYVLAFPVSIFSEEELDELRAKSKDFPGLKCHSVAKRLLNQAEGDQPKPIDLGNRSCWNAVKKVEIRDGEVRITVQCIIDTFGKEIKKKLLGSCYYLRFFFQMKFCLSGRLFEFSIDMKKDCRGRKDKDLPYRIIPLKKIPFNFSIKKLQRMEKKKKKKKRRSEKVGRKRKKLVPSPSPSEKIKIIRKKNLVSPKPKFVVEKQIEEEELEEERNEMEFIQMEMDDFNLENFQDSNIVFGNIPPPLPLFQIGYVQGDYFGGFQF